MSGKLRLLVHQKSSRRDGRRKRGVAVRHNGHPGKIRRILCASHRESSSGAYATGFASTIRQHAHRSRSSRPPPAEQAVVKTVIMHQQTGVKMIPREYAPSTFRRRSFPPSSSSTSATGIYSTALPPVRMALCNSLKPPSPPGDTVLHCKANDVKENPCINNNAPKTAYGRALPYKLPFKMADGTGNVCYDRGHFRKEDCGMDGAVPISNAA